ncbi:MAG: ABC transporter substrate-binding protein [Spirochaetaceae bacterium]|jgi:multiple sugar transport system substrate-binding protein|nr:ABC transporter substrate-binding protein [Spirochaetaceae bacterium]
MKKIVMAILAGAFCGAFTPLFAGGSKESNSGVTVVRVWSDQGSEKDVRDVQIARFNEGRGKELGIKIEYTVSSSSTYHDLIRNAALANELPELFRASVEDLQFFAGAGHAVPVAEMPGGQAMIDLYKGQLVNNLQIFNGKVYSFPYGMTSFKLIVNKDLFEKSGIPYPKTWAEVRAAARKITENGNGQEFGWITGLRDAWVSRSYFFAPMASNTGLNAGFDNEKLQYNYSAMLPGIEAVYGMISDGSVFPGFEGLSADQFRAQFAEGRVGMIMGASFDVGVYTTQFPAKCNWDVIDVPAFTDAGLPYVDFVDASNLLAIGNAAKKNPEKVMEVYKFFYSDENMAEMYEKGKYVPFRSEVLQYVKNPPSANFQKFANLPQKAILLPTPENEQVIEGSTYRETLQNIFARKYTNQSIADVLADLDRRSNAAAAKLGAAKLEVYRTSRDTRRK